MSRVHLPLSLPAALAALAAGAVLLAPPATAAGGALSGTWTSTDTDGSHQTLVVNGSGTRAYSMVYTDDEATGACGGAPARLSGPGYVDGDSVTMMAVLVCVPGGNVLHERLTLGFHHDAGSDTLLDDFGIVWERAG
jgi:hypothetical protein